MSNDVVLPFADLVAYRSQLQKFCSTHYKSLIAFQDGISFKLITSESKLGPNARHLTSSATCIESLLECPQEFLPKKGISLSNLAKDFSLSALSRPHNEWVSDGSASIYCRCRTLPLIVNHLPRYSDRIQQHLKRILSQLNFIATRLAIGEATAKSSDRDDWYPPNAYHTYWTLYLLDLISKKFPSNYESLRSIFSKTRFDLDRIRAEMLMWAQYTTGYQIALHASDSSTLDSDQLAWALAIIITFKQDFQSNLAQQDFIRHAFKCLFAHQTKTGIWRTGAPLFHYVESGNAYCYVFETFSVVLKNALTDRKEGIFLRHVLRPYLPNLLALWRYAVSTQIPLREEGQIAWSSGHRANHKEPESWATASVFSFSHCLRRLIGIWTRESVAEELKVIRTHTSPNEAVQTLLKRGATWGSLEKSAANQLITLFVNPVQFFESGNNLEPDSQPINEDQACAAILFGPPGTSKTTLSKCVAEAIGWDYVELHASHFVADGLPNVQRTANTIFEKLLQLDRTVILFDEIDELVRAREVEPDAFGRFLTTSMLPKLAELWKLKKVIYFVATNHISFFDSAVIRAQRFDALVRVSPPCMKSKLTRLKEILQDYGYQVTLTRLGVTEAEKSLHNIPINHNGSSQDPNVDELPLPDSCVLAKLILMRWDQLQELAAIICTIHGTKKKLTLSRMILEDALSKISDPFLKKCKLFREYIDSGKYEQHDFNKVTIWKVRSPIPSKHKNKFIKKLNSYWYESKASFGDYRDFPGKCRLIQPGTLQCH